MSHDTQVKQEAPERCVLCGHSDGLREPEGHCVICGCSCEFIPSSATDKRLPAWSDCELAVDERRATPLQKFIYEFEPGSNDRQWREGLLAALATVRKEEREAALRDVLMVAKANLKIGPTGALDTGWNLALAEIIKDWNTRVTAPIVAPTVDRALYSELIHIAAELARGNGFLSTCAEDMSPRLKRADILKTAERQEERLKDWAYRVRQVANKLSPAIATASPVERSERSNHFSNAAIDKGTFPDHISSDGTAYYADGTILRPTPAPPVAPKSLLREPVKVDVSSPLIVTRNGVPCPDQEAALEEFKEACRVRAPQVEKADADGPVAEPRYGERTCKHCSKPIKNTPRRPNRWTHIETASLFCEPLSPSTLAKAAAEEIYEFGKYDLSPERAKAQIAAIIERCLSAGSES